MESVLTSIFSIRHALPLRRIHDEKRNRVKKLLFSTIFIGGCLLLLLLNFFPTIKPFGSTFKPRQGHFATGLAYYGWPSRFLVTHLEVWRGDIGRDFDGPRISLVDYPWCDEKYGQMSASALVVNTLMFVVESAILYILMNYLVYRETSTSKKVALFFAVVLAIFLPAIYSEMGIKDKENGYSVRLLWLDKYFGLK
jgi:hypothetical protein